MAGVKAVIRVKELDPVALPDVAFRVFRENLQDLAYRWNQYGSPQDRIAKQPVLD
jgi:hypothetical protein